MGRKRDSSPHGLVRLDDTASLAGPRVWKVTDNFNASSNKNDRGLGFGWGCPAQVTLPEPASPKHQMEALREFQGRCFSVKFPKTQAEEFKKGERLHMPRSVCGPGWRYTFIWDVKASIFMLPGPQIPFKIMYFIWYLRYKSGEISDQNPHVSKGLCVSIFLAEDPLLYKKGRSNSRETKTIICLWLVASSFCHSPSLQYYSIPLILYLDILEVIHGYLIISCLLVCQLCGGGT